MSKLKKLIVKLTSNDKNYEKKLASIAGCSVATMNKFKNDESREFADFNGLINIIKEVAAQTSYDSKELIADYTNTIDVNRVTARYMLEYLSVNRHLNEMVDLLDRMEAASNKDSKEWVLVYKLLYKWQTEYETLDNNQFISDVNSLPINDNLLKICTDLLRCNAYYNKMNFKLVYELSKEIENKIQMVDQSYIKTTYTVKVNEFHSLMNLWVKKNYPGAREKAEYVLNENVGETFNGQAQFVWGCSYFYDSYDEALNHLEKSHQIYKRLDRQTAAKDVEERIQLLNCYWNKGLNTDQFLVTNLLCEINNGKNISSRLEDAKGEIDKPFYNLLKGLNDKNKDNLLLSTIQFLKNGDTFNANYPKVKLLDMGFNPEVLEELLMMHVD